MSVNPLVTTEEEQFHGRALAWSCSALGYLSHFIRFHNVLTTFAFPVLRLPDASKLTPGGPVVVVHIRTGSFSTFVRSYTGSTSVQTIAAGDTYEFYLLDNSDSDGEWIARDVSSNFTKTTVSNHIGMVPMFFGGDEDASNAREFNPYLNAWTERTDGTNDHEGGSGFTLVTTSANIGYVAGHESSLKHDAYDYTTQAWAAQTDVPGTTSKHQAGGAGGFDGATPKGYLFGGFDNTTAQDRADKYTPGGGWASLTAMSESRAHMATDRISSRSTIYLVGGSQFGNMTFSTRKVLGFNYSTEAYRNVTRYPYTARSDADAAVSGGKLYVFGGFNGTASFDDSEEYDPASDSWNFTVPEVPWGNVLALGAVSKESNDESYPTIIVAGGRLKTTGAAYNDCAEYSPLARSWTTKQDIDVSTSRWDGQCSAISK